MYVDYDPIVLAHAHALLTSHEAGATEYIDADLRDSPAILGQAARLLDFTKPVAVTLLLVLHVIPDSDDPHALVARVMDALPSGSYLALSQLGSDLLGQEAKQGFEGVVSRSAQQQYIGRSREQMARPWLGARPARPDGRRSTPACLTPDTWHPGRTRARDRAPRTRDAYHRRCHPIWRQVEDRLCAFHGERENTREPAPIVVTSGACPDGLCTRP